MRLHDRYITKQLIISTLFAVAVLSVILILGNLYRQARPLLVEQHIPLQLLLKFLWNVMPASLMYTIPWGFLVAVMMVFGRLSSHSEITSFRAAGLSLFRISLPAMLVGAMFSGICLWLNLNVVPNAKASMAEILIDQAKRDPRALLTPGMVQANFDKIKHYIEHCESDQLTGFYAYKMRSDEDLQKDPDAYPAEFFLYAQEVSFSVPKDHSQIQLKLRQAMAENCQAATKIGEASRRVLMNSEDPYIIPIPAFTKRIKAGAMDNTEITHYLSLHPELEQSAKIYQAQQAALPKSEFKNFLKTKPELERQTESWLKFKSVSRSRFSFSLACLAFAFVGIPLSLQPGRRDNSYGMIMSLILAVLYFVGMTAAEKMPTIEWLTIALWLPNFLCIGIGSYLMHRASRR